MGSINGVKLSVSLSTDDVALLDEYARLGGYSSRSAVLQRAIRLLREAKLEDDYASAWDEWEASGDEAVWASTTSDGISRAAG